MAQIIPFPVARSEENTKAIAQSAQEVAVGGGASVTILEEERHLFEGDDRALELGFLAGGALTEKELVHGLDHQDEAICRRVVAMLAMLSSSDAFSAAQSGVIGRVLFERLFCPEVAPVRRKLYAEVLSMGYGEPWVGVKLCVRLRFGDPWERELAAVALGNPGNVDAIPALVAALESDDEAGVKQAAAQSLGALHDSRVVPILVRALRRKPTRALRLELLRALRSFRDLQSAWIFLSHLQVPDIEVQRVSLGAFVHMPCREGYEVALDFLRHADHSLRIIALRIIERSGAKRDCARIKLLLNDPEHRVRQVAQGALETLSLRTFQVFQ